MSSIITISKSNQVRKSKRVDLYNIFLNIVLLLVIIATILLVINPTRYISSINAGINLFFVSVFPSLFPFLFLSKLLEGLGAFSKFNTFFRPITKKLFKCPEIAGYPLIMTIISGYPVGAKIVGDLSKNNLISPSEAKRIITLSSTSGPIFIIGSVGAGMLNNPKLGALIFLCHMLGSFVTAFLFTFKKNTIREIKQKSETLIPRDILTTATQGTIFSILTVAVYVSIFYMFIDMAYDLKILGAGSYLFKSILNMFSINPEFGNGLASGLLEMTRGCKEIISVGNDFYSLVFCSGLISFGGLSIILQSLTFLAPSKISPIYFLFFKTIQMVVTIIISIPIGLLVI